MAPSTINPFRLDCTDPLFDKLDSGVTFDIPCNHAHYSTAAELAQEGKPVYFHKYQLTYRGFGCEVREYEYKFQLTKYKIPQPVSKSKVGEGYVRCTFRKPKQIAKMCYWRDSGFPWKLLEEIGEFVHDPDVEEFPKSEDE